MFSFSPVWLLLLVLASSLLYVLLSPRTTATLLSVRAVCLWGSFFALAIGVSMSLTLDKAAVGYQFMSSIGFVSEYNSAFALGVDGLSYVFLMLTLFTFPFLFLAA